ncbi:hypothetical protein Lal_00024888 [Lupinus albus]|nr:hypothetical protein Lal_00024888 [Lupinus albus]
MLTETVLHHWDYFSQKQFCIIGTIFLKVRSVHFRIPEACGIALNFLLEVEKSHCVEFLAVNRISFYVNRNSFASFGLFFSEACGIALNFLLEVEKSHCIEFLAVRNNFASLGLFFSKACGIALNFLLEVEKSHRVEFLAVRQKLSYIYCNGCGDAFNFLWQQEIYQEVQFKKFKKKPHSKKFNAMTELRTACIELLRMEMAWA